MVGTNILIKNTKPRILFLSQVMNVRGEHADARCKKVHQEQMVYTLTKFVNQCIKW